MLKNHKQTSWVLDEWEGMTPTSLPLFKTTEWIIPLTAEYSGYKWALTNHITKLL